MVTEIKLFTTVVLIFLFSKSATQNLSNGFI